MTHTHDFHRISEVTKPGNSNRGIAGVEVVCVDCGEVRRAFSDGTIVMAQASTMPAPIPQQSP